MDDTKPFMFTTLLQRLEVQTQGAEVQALLGSCPRSNVRVHASIKSC